jgi:hypothetical protein
MASGPRVDLDWPKLDAKAIVEEAKIASAAQASNVASLPVGSFWVTRDCARLHFEPNGPSVSESVWLRSTEWRQECTYIPLPPSGGNYVCRDVPGWTYQQRAQAEIVNRQSVLPWERETFEVCLQGNWLNFYTINAAYDYQVRNNHDGYYTLTPGKKIAMNPDPTGITMHKWLNTGKGLVMEFSDRWASHYGAGEQTVIHVAIYGRKLAAEGDITFTPAGTYRLDLAQLNVKLEAGREYYAKWGFKRMGSISKSTYIRRGETEKVVYTPAPGGLAK